MTISHFKTFFEADKNALGFYGYDIFEINSEEINLLKILESNLLLKENIFGDFEYFKLIAYAYH